MSDRIPEKTDRNIELYKDYQSYLKNEITMVSMVTKYGISPAMIHRIGKNKKYSS